MRVGDQHMTDRASGHGAQQGVQVSVIQRPRINDRHACARPVSADDIGPRTREGERPRIVRDQALNQRRDLIASSIGEVELANVRDHSSLQAVRASNRGR